MNAVAWRPIIGIKDYVGALKTWKKSECACVRGQTSVRVWVCSCECVCDEEERESERWLWHHRWDVLRSNSFLIIVFLPKAVKVVGTIRPQIGKWYAKQGQLQHGKEQK